MKLRNASKDTYTTSLDARSDAQGHIDFVNTLKTPSHSAGA